MVSVEGRLFILCSWDRSTLEAFIDGTTNEWRVAAGEVPAPRKWYPFAIQRMLRHVYEAWLTAAPPVPILRDGVGIVMGSG